MFRRLPGPAGDSLAHLRALPALRGARLDVAWRGRLPTRLAVGIGQVHPVLQGHFSRSLTRQIGLVQGWIADLCEALYQREGIRTFGQEGLHSEAAGDGPVRLTEEILAPLRQRLQTRHPTLVLYSLAVDWHDALRRDDGRAIAQAATALNALAILQALHEDVAIVPIEQADAHGPIGEGIRLLHARLSEVETSHEFQLAKQKSGRNLTANEATAVRTFNDLQKQFQTLLTHPERDRALFREVTKRAEGQAVSVFVLGAAHQAAQLRLARTYLPDDLALVWITPPHLRSWWVRHARSLCIAAAATLALLSSLLR
jgi:hypothetical protein